MMAAGTSARRTIALGRGRLSRSARVTSARATALVAMMPPCPAALPLPAPTAPPGGAAPAQASRDVPRAVCSGALRLLPLGVRIPDADAIVRHAPRDSELARPGRKAPPAANCGGITRALPSPLPTPSAKPGEICLCWLESHH